MGRGLPYHDAAGAAATLAWWLEAGVDTLVADRPGSWLSAAAPAAVPAAAAAPAAPRPLRAPLRDTAPAPSPHAAQAEALAMAAADLPALAAAVAGFAHPLNDGSAPQLPAAPPANGVVVLSDYPEAPDGEAAVLRARMLAAIGLDLADTALIHLLPWPTPAGRAPRPDEVAAFRPLVQRAIVLAAPRAVLAFGAHAAALASDGGGIASLRGRWLTLDGLPFLATYHPRTLLTQQAWKKAAWADLQQFRVRLTELAQ